MKTARMLTIWIVGLALLVCGARVSEAAEMGTGFTYQGHLYDANRPANGRYDFQFKLYDDANVIDGNQVGTDFNKHNIDVIDGYFTVVLNFGSVFMGDGVWLHVGVRPGELEDPNVYTTLVPRAELTPTPQAIYAKNTDNDNDWTISDSDMYSIPSGNVGIGTTEPSAKLEVNGQIKITGGSPGWDKVLTSNHEGLASWRTPDPDINSVIAGTGLSGGGTSGDVTLDVQVPLSLAGSSSGAIISAANTGSGNGIYGNALGDYGYAVYGYASGNNGRGVYGYASSSTGYGGYFAGNAKVTGDLTVGGNVGLSTTAPTEKLDVNGNININSVYKIGGQTTLSVAGMSNIFAGGNAGAINTGTGNTFVGDNAGFNNTSGSTNTFVGARAGYSNTTGGDNTFLGCWAGYLNTTASRNTFLGKLAGYANTTGLNNTFLGRSAGISNTTGGDNTLVGHGAGYSNSAGYRNTFLGKFAGYFNTTGAGNVFVGYRAGYNETGDNKLYIANGPNDADVLIYGDFDTGRVGIGTTSPQGTLDVNGPIYQRGGVLHADYVFEPGYELESIGEHSEIMWSERHLPAIPRAKVDESGQEVVEVGAHRKGIVEELEKAHIYIEQLHKRIGILEARLVKLEMGG
ncbi:MAG: hypothetical protein JSV99_06590 [Planctomycetota bacterium]|nr:MAG: hypothetical protein JSV99_06590 [Planctomycetota bacterium]